MPPFYLVTFMIATVVAAGVLCTVVVVMVTFYIRIESERAAEECFDCSIAGTVNTTEKLDAGLGKCHLCAATDAAANKSINTENRKKSRKCSVTATVSINNFAVYNFSVLCGIDLKLLGMTEVLKDLSVLMSYCNFRCAVSFEFSIVKDFSAFLNCTVKRIAVKVTAITSATGSAV